MIWWEDEKTFCEKVDDDQAINVIRLDVQTLTTMLMGYKRPSYLYRQQSVGHGILLGQDFGAADPPRQALFFRLFLMSQSPFPMIVGKGL